VPYSRNNNFIARENSLRRIKKAAGNGGHVRLALHGPGGIGKTQVALEYAYQHADRRSVFWVCGNEFLGFSEDFRSILPYARIPHRIAANEEKELLRTVRDWFESPASGDWVLVIDGADNEADCNGKGPISEFLPRGPKGTIIFTTRSRRVAEQQGCEIIEIGKMGDRDARALFLSRLENPKNLSEADRKALTLILHSLDNLPLALLLPSKIHDIQREVGMTESILNTYFLTFDQLQERMPFAADILRLFAFFDHKQIPEKLLMRSNLDGVHGEGSLDDAIAKLVGLSLVINGKDGAGRPAYELHRLVRHSIQEYLSEEEALRWKEKALEVVWRLFPHYKHEVLQECVDYLPHALAVTENSTSPMAEEVCFRMALYLKEAAHHGTAEAQIRRCIKLREESGGASYGAEYWSRIGLLASILLELGYAEEAEVEYRRAVRGRTKALGTNHPDTLSSINGLAVALHFQGRYQEAEKLYRSALEGREIILKHGHRDVLESVALLGEVLEFQEKHEEAEVMCRRALEGRKGVLGPYHPDTLETVFHLASALQGQGKHDEAEVLCRRVLEAFEKALWQDDSRTLLIIHKMAEVLQEGRRVTFAEAEALNRRIHERCERALGAEHQLTRASMNNLAGSLSDQGKYHEAAATTRLAMEILEECEGPDHPDIPMILYNLTQMLQDEGKYDEAEVSSRRIVKFYEKILGPDHPGTLVSHSILAGVLRDQKRYDEAEEMLRDAVKIMEKVLGPEDPDTLEAIDSLAFVLQQEGRYGEAENLHLRALEGREKVLGGGAIDTLTSLWRLAKLYKKCGQAADADSAYRSVCTGLCGALGGQHSISRKCLDEYEAFQVEHQLIDFTK
ncbi:protein prenylyltransferase, partial [Tuber magnatum]